MEKSISAHSRHAALLLDVFRPPLQVSCLQTMSFGSASGSTGGGLQVCPVWHLKHLRSLPCRGRSDGLDRLALPGAGGPLSNLPGSAWGGRDSIEELLAGNTNYHDCLALRGGAAFSGR